MTQAPVRPFKPLGSASLAVFRAMASALSPLGSAYVWLMYRKELDEPLTPYHAKIAIDIGLAEDAEMDTLAALVYPYQPRKAAARAHIYRDRLRGGSLCFVARIDGAIVASNWIRVKTAVGVDQMRMHFGDDEIYTTDAYTAHEWRGQGIHPALNQTMLEYARQQGYRVAYTLVRADNERSSVTMGRVGWRLAASMLYFRPSWSPDKALWWVWGDPYPMPVGRGAGAMPAAGPAAEEAVAAAPPAADGEAASFDLAQFDQRELVADRPWAKTYRLRKDDGSIAWLKIVPEAHAGVLRAAVLLAAGFPAHLPQVIACDDRRHGWLLTHDHGGTALDRDAPIDDLLAMVETFARLQAAMVSNQEMLDCLPAARVTQCLTELIDFLRPDWTTADARQRVGAAYFIGAAEAQAFYDELQQAAPQLARQLAAASSLPATVDHGDLQPSHAARTPDGQIVLFNWTSARRGPAGLSLHRVFGGVLPALEALQPAVDDCSAYDRHRQLMARYVDTLAAAAYADEQSLRAGLPAAIMAGAMLDLLRFAEYATADADQRAWIGERLLTDLGMLRSLCVHLTAADRRRIEVPGS
ncbi:N-acetyltransferase family protein [Piscinibacter sakaiensis]|uniref:GNAT family N-acetyltransferase n=1 Tax=Piscinibacter sakaiensis TaxID=1547922 RepID=UPI003AB078EB